jgi:plasmid stabilization system protein ParE
VQASTSRRLRWSPRALAAFEKSLLYIAADDPAAAVAVITRTDHSLTLLRSHPGIGTPTARPGVRRHPIPNTGHVILYRVVKGELRVLRWFRARQNVRE